MGFFDNMKKGDGSKADYEMMPNIQNLKMKEKKETKQYVYAIVGVVAAAAIFCGLVYLERYINTPKHYTMTIVTSKAIPKGTVITKKNWKKYLTGINMDDTIRPEDAMSTVNDLIGRKTLVSMSKGAILSKKATVSTKDIENIFTDPVEVSMAVSAENADAGLLRKGDLVNFMLSAKDDDTVTANFVMENVYVKNAFDGDGNPISSADNATRASMLQLLMDKDEQIMFGKAMASGNTMTVSRIVNTADGYEKVLNEKKNSDAEDAKDADKSDKENSDGNAENNISVKGSNTESLTDGVNTERFADTNADGEFSQESVNRDTKTAE